MSIADKIRAVLTIKNQLKAAITAKGVPVTDAVPFSQYPAKIALINAIIDTTPPVVNSFTITVNADKSATVTGKTEAGATVILKNPNNVIIPLTVNADGSFSGVISAVAVEGNYVLTVADEIGNSATTSQLLELPKATDPILALFSGGVVGAYYDPNDLSTLFQDSAGTIPVTAVGQTVGMMKDKSGNGKHMIQPTVSKQPKLAVHADTGAYALSWDGADDHMYAQVDWVSNATTMFDARCFYNNTCSSNLILTSDIRDLLYFVDKPCLILSNIYNTSSGYVTSKASRYVTGEDQSITASSNDRKRILGVTSPNVTNMFRLYVNRTKYNNAGINDFGQNWGVGAGKYLNLGFAHGLLFKTVLIGKTLTTTELDALQNHMNIDVGAW